MLVLFTTKTTVLKLLKVRNYTPDKRFLTFIILIHVKNEPELYEIIFYWLFLSSKVSIQILRNKI